MPDEDTETWAISSLRIEPGEADLAEIAAAMGAPDEPGAPCWVATVTPSAERHLQEHLDDIEAYLLAHRDALVSLAGRAEVRLYISWAPGASQNNVELSEQLIRLLADAGAHLWLDTCR